MSCPICEKRPSKRFCPAKGEKICAICCGREREVTIDCPSNCSHLISAHRYEAEHRTLLSADELPYKSIEFPMEFVYQRWPAITAIATAILGFQAQNRDLHDSDTSAAMEALAETYRTLGTGIYYERPPVAPLARGLYGQITQYLQEFRKSGTGQPDFPSLRDSDVFQLIVFLLRIAKHEVNGRPRSRAFLDFLRGHFPLPAQTASAGMDEPRIVLL
jgi:hypothetical protein